jgi:hypothetical protein
MPSSPNSFSKQYCAFNKARWPENIIYIKVQLVVGINNSNNIHELLVRKLSWKFINEANS